MEEFTELIQTCSLFANISDSELSAMMNCLMAVKYQYDKNEFIFMAGDPARSVGIVISGSANILKEDYWGNRTILANIEPGQLFAEAFSCMQTDRLPVSVIATEKTEILLLEYNRIITTCSLACTYHTKLIQNMMRILAQKNVMLTQKMAIVTHRTTRDRLLAYLSGQAFKAGNSRFTIPFSRQELADYLSVERSAMSAELSRMQADGLIRTKRSSFELLFDFSEEKI